MTRGRGRRGWASPPSRGRKGAPLSSTSALFPTSRCRGQGVQQQGPKRAAEFWKGRVMTGYCKNPFLPQPAAHGRDGIGEGRILLAAPVANPYAAVASRHLGEQVGYDGVQAE